MILIPGNSLYIGIYLCLVTDDLNIADLTVTLLAMHDKKAVLEHRTCIYLERRVVRQVCCPVMNLQEYVIRHRPAYRKVEFEEALGEDCVLDTFAMLIDIRPAPVKIKIVEVLLERLFDNSLDAACPVCLLQRLLYLYYIAFGRLDYRRSKCDRHYLIHRIQGVVIVTLVLVTARKHKCRQEEQKHPTVAVYSLYHLFHIIALR